MAELLCLDLVAQRLVTDSISLYIGYSHTVGYPSSGGSIALRTATSSAILIRPQIADLFERIVNPYVPIRRINISFNRVMDEAYQQYDLFTDPYELERERRMQKAAIEIKNRFGKNLILKGMNLEKSATTIERNAQIGGHKSGV